MSSRPRSSGPAGPDAGPAWFPRVGLAHTGTVSTSDPHAGLTSVLKVSHHHHHHHHTSDGVWSRPRWVSLCCGSHMPIRRWWHPCAVTCIGYGPGLLATTSFGRHRARLREPQLEKDGSTAHEDAGSGAGWGWRSTVDPIVVGKAHTPRQLCDGQSLVAPGHWFITSRGNP